MNINTALSGAANLLALINLDNSSSIALSQIDFAAPSVAAGTGGRNTSAVLTMKANQAYEGSQTFSYIRLAVGAAIAAPVTTYGYVNTTTWNQLKTSIAAGLGVREEDITFANLPDVGGLPVTYNDATGEATHDGTQYTIIADLYGFDQPTGPDFDVIAKADSYLYIGTQAVDLTWDRPEINTILTVTDLTGFEAEE